MQAAHIHSYGGPETIVVEEVARPAPAAGEMLVKVYAAALNPVDRFTRAGYLQGMGDFPLPLTLGLDFSGVVEAIGAGVTDAAVGDEVYGFSRMMRQGAYAEYVVVDADEIAPKPASIDHVTAAAVPLAAITAWQGLFDIGGLQAGQTVLIHGAGGGVGTLAVQLAAAKGARVLGTAAPDKLDLVRELGVTEAIDYTATRFEDTARDVDLVFDTVGGDVQARSLAVLKPGGILVTSAGQPAADAATALNVRASGMTARANPAQLAEIARMIDAGTVKPIVTTVLPLAAARQAHELLEAGHTRGKIVLQVVDA